MAACSFCGSQIPIGTGTTLFKRDGTAINYCSRKCEKNYKMKRNPIKFKWTQKFVKTVAKVSKPVTSAPATSQVASKTAKGEKK